MILNTARSTAKLLVKIVGHLLITDRATYWSL